MHSIALLITLVLTGTQYQYALLEKGYQPQPTATQADLFTWLSWGVLQGLTLPGLRRFDRGRSGLDRIPRLGQEQPPVQRTRRGIGDRVDTQPDLTVPDLAQ